MPTGSEKVGDSGEEEDSLSYAPTDPLDTGTKIKDKTRGKDSMQGPRQKDIGLSPITPWVSEISKNYIFSDLLNSTNLLYFFVPENLPKSAPKNGPKFHVLFVS